MRQNTKRRQAAALPPNRTRWAPVQLGLSGCVFGIVQFATRAFRAARVADVQPGAAPRSL
jgi:hypothetical protein